MHFKSCFSIFFQLWGETWHYLADLVRRTKYNKYTAVLFFLPLLNIYFISSWNWGWSNTYWVEKNNTQKHWFDSPLVKLWRTLCIWKAYFPSMAHLGAIKGINNQTGKLLTEDEGRRENEENWDWEGTSKDEICPPHLELYWALQWFSCVFTQFKKYYI